MSESGQKATSEGDRTTSALPSNSDVDTHNWDVGFTPMSGHRQPGRSGPKSASSGHVVGGLIGQDKAGAVRAKGAELAFHFWGLTCAKH
jgi:hypothetical protein